MITPQDIVYAFLRKEYPRPVDPDRVACVCGLTTLDVDDAIAQLDHAGLIRSAPEGLWRARPAPTA